MSGEKGSAPSTPKAAAAAAASEASFSDTEDNVNAGANATPLKKSPAKKSSGSDSKEPAAVANALSADEKKLIGKAKWMVINSKTGEQFGTTFVKKTKPDQVNCYEAMAASELKVRVGPNYAYNKKKAPSARALYDVIGVDLFRFDKKVSNFGAHTEMRWAKAPTACSLPDLLIMNCMIPEYAPPNPIWGAAKDDGDGYAVVIYFGLADWARAEAQKEEDEQPASFRLFRRFMKTPASSAFKDRFKIITRICNPSKISLNGAARALVHQYNGRPFLSRPQHSFFVGDNSYSIDLDVHRFSYMARLGLAGIKASVNSVIFDFALVVQGDSDGELPEQILGAVRIHKPDLAKASRPKMS